MSETQFTEPYACECKSGSYIVVQARNQTEAISRVEKEYGQEVLTCRKVD